MTLKEIVYDIKEIITHSNIVDENINDLDWLAYKIHNYRAVNILKYYNISGLIDDVHVQPYYNRKVNKISSSELSIKNYQSSLKFGKIAIPQLVYINNIRDGIERISPVSGQLMYRRIGYDTLINMIQTKDKMLYCGKYYFVRGNELFLYPYIDEIKMDLIMYNPLEGHKYEMYIIMSGDLVDGKQYKVVSNSIKYNDQVYGVGEVFTTNSTLTYEGKGYVTPYPQYKQLTWNDEYPISNLLLQQCVISILTNDLALRESAVTDIINDGSIQSQLITLMNNSSQQKTNEAVAKRNN